MNDAHTTITFTWRNPENVPGWAMGFGVVHSPLTDDEKTVHFTGLGSVTLYKTERSSEYFIHKATVMFSPFSVIGEGK